MGETGGDTAEKTLGKTLDDIRQRGKRLSRKKPEGTGQVFSIGGFLRCLWILQGKADMP